MKVLDFGSKAVLAVVVALAGCGNAPEPADLVVLGGKIITMDEGRPEAEALAARGQTIVAVGDEDEVRRMIGPDTEVVNLDGATAVPGLIEAHGHFLSLGRAKMQLDLTSTSSWQAIVDMVAEAAESAEPGRWIFGRGWHQEKWDALPEPSVEGLPVHDALSAVSPDNPVMLTHASGHAAMVNARAMELAGVDSGTADPPGGEIVRDRQGRPIGVLRETAEELVGRVADRDTGESTMGRMAELAAAECLAHGITSFQDAGSSFEQVEFLRGLAVGGELPVRLWIMLADDNETLAEKLPGYGVSGEGGGYLTVGGIKRWVDGALGSHGAWLLEPYTDLPSSSGLNIVTVEELRESARLAAEHRLQLCSHAIGDRANRETLDVYQEVLETLPDGMDRRWRIEHAQHLHPDDVGRFAELGVVAAMQPIHCTSDGPWVAVRLGQERARQGSYLWRDLLDSGAVIAAGTDVPVEAIDPIANFHAGVTRLTSTGEAFYPDQRMTRAETLRSVTLDAAFAAFEEDSKGSLEVGKLADITVLSMDPLTAADDQIPRMEVVTTVVGGEIRYDANP